MKSFINKKIKLALEEHLSSHPMKPARHLSPWIDVERRDFKDSLDEFIFREAKKLSRSPEAIMWEIKRNLSNVIRI
jgi:hypothetical protein